MAGYTAGCRVGENVVVLVGFRLAKIRIWSIFINFLHEIDTPIPHCENLTDFIHESVKSDECPRLAICQPQYLRSTQLKI